MKFIYVFTFILVSTFNFLPKKSILNLLRDKSSIVILHIDSIPSAIFKKMNTVVSEQFAFASPKDEFNESDIVKDERLPSRRLIFALHSKDEKEWLIYYEKGGRSYNTFLSYAKLSKDGHVECIYNLSPKSKKGKIQKEELIESLKSDNFTVIYDNGKPLQRNYQEF